MNPTIKLPITRSPLACGRTLPGLACGIFMVLGVLTRCAAQEMTSAGNPQLKAFFQQHPDADGNRDGVLTADEPPYTPYLRDPAGYQWKFLPKTSAGNGAMVYRLTLTSQIWHGATWTHPVQIVVPKNLMAPDIALVFAWLDPNGAGFPIAKIAEETGITCVGTEGMYQACLGAPSGLGIMTYGTQQYLKTGDPTWVALAAAVKSLIRTMDAVEEWSGKETGTPIRRFILAGHSQMGMASWSTAVSDPRVKGIIPAGANSLNLPAQPKILSWVELAFGPIAQTDAGKKYLAMCDPYTYRRKLTAAKLVVLGTDDPGCDPTIVDQYWDGVPGSKSHLYLDNADHSHEWNAKSFRGIIAFSRAVALKKELPKIEWTFTEAGGTLKVQATPSVPAKSARLWSATGPFDSMTALGIPPKIRSYSKWTDLPMKAAADGRIFSGEVAKPPAGVAAYAELEFEQDGKSYQLTTALHIMK